MATSQAMIVLGQSSPQLRAESGLPPVAFSKKLTMVAQAHARDSVNYPNEDNMHSWSNNGNWKGGQYNSQDQSTYNIMWNKPAEIAGYQSRGYEISSMGTHYTPTQHLQNWKTSEAHNSVILNQGMWKDLKWNAMGVGVYKGYTHVWFGELADPSQ